MAGRNLFETYQYYGRTAAASTCCVFISHNSKDKSMARVVATALLEMGVDIYFDERDLILKDAAAAGQDVAIVKCIEDGLNRSTHLLGLITRNTFQSWWVPYEIGGANGRSRTCGHLVSSDVTRLPSYVKVSPILLDIDALATWVAGSIRRKKEVIRESMAHTTVMGIQAYVPMYRPQSQITYY